MSKSVVILNGSPRQGGHCSRLIAEVARGVAAKGGTVKTYDLNNPGVRGCQGCFYCRANPTCSINDYLTPMYADLAEADAVVFASPIYFGQVTGQAKIGIDRLFPMIDGTSFKPRHPGKKGILIFAQGDGSSPERFRPAINAVHGFFTTFGWEVKETLVSFGASSTGMRVAEDLLRRAFAAGEKLV